jgi:hypothetical protein
VGVVVELDGLLLVAVFTASLVAFFSGSLCLACWVVLWVAVVFVDGGLMR